MCFAKTYMHSHLLFYAGLFLTLIFDAGVALAQEANPFSAPSTLPLQAPRFDQIKDTDYMPAFDEGIKQQLAEIDRIANNPAAPTFENTVVAIESLRPHAGSRLRNFLRRLPGQHQ